MSVPAAADAAAAGGRLVRVDRSGTRVTVTLRQPIWWYGPVALAVAAALRDVLRRLTGDVEVLVFRPVTDSAADGSAAQGSAADTVAAAGVTPEGRDEPHDVWYDVVDRLSGRPDLLTLAVVDGPTAGPGLALALACDLRILTDDAVMRVGEPAAGLVPAWGVGATLIDLLGYSRALDLCLTGRRVTADEAARLGLASRVLPRPNLDRAVDETVDALSAVSRTVATETKALLRQMRVGLAPADRRGVESAALRRCRAVLTGDGAGTAG